MGRTPNGARIKTSLDSSSDQYPSHRRPPALESLSVGIQVSLLNHDGSNLGRARKNKHSLRSHLSVLDRTDAIRLDTSQNMISHYSLNLRENLRRLSWKINDTPFKCPKNQTKLTFPCGIGPSEAASGACPCVHVWPRSYKWTGAVGQCLS